MSEENTKSKSSNGLLIFLGIVFFIALFAFGQYSLKSYQAQYKKTELMLHEQNKSLKKLVKTQQQQHTEIIALQQQQNQNISNADVDLLGNKSELGVKSELSNINDDELLNLGDEVFKEASLSSQNTSYENNSTSVAKKNELDITAQIAPGKNTANHLYDERLRVCEKFFKRRKIRFGNENALSCYKKILAEDPNNKKAQQGLIKIEDYYVDVIGHEMKRNNKSKVSKFVHSLTVINPKHPLLPDVNKWIKTRNHQAKTRSIKETSQQNTPYHANKTLPAVKDEKPSSKVSNDKQPDSLAMIKVKAGCDWLLLSEKKFSKECVQKDFYLAKYEVTQKLWQQVMGKNPSRFASCGEFCPVENVSWFDVQEFIRKLNIKKNSQYRLPTEIEWEFVARAGKQEAYGFSNSAERLYQYANFCDKRCANPVKNKLQDDGFKTTAPIGSFKPNAWGVYDMQGNVWEWVVDRMMSSDLNKLPQHIYRGGSWGDQIELLKLGSRASADAELRVSGIGFRLALSAE